MTNDRRFHFLPMVTTQKRSRRDIELAHASAKSHLARTSHRRRRAAIGQPLYLEEIPLAQSQTVPAFEDADTSDPDTYEIATKSSPSQALLFYRPNAWPVLSDKFTNPTSIQLLQYCLTDLWPGYDPGATLGSLRTPFVSTWSEFEAEGPALFHCLIWHAAVHLSYQRNTPIKDYQSISHYHQALQHLSKLLSRPIAEIAESTVYAIVGLITLEMSPNDGLSHHSSECGFRSPLVDLQWMSVHGRQPLSDSHVNALYRFIDYKGGLDALQTPGFAGAIQFVDIIQSTFHLTRSHFPLMQYFEDFAEQYWVSVKDINRNSARIHNKELRTVETDYMLPTERSACFISESQVDVLLNLRNWTRLHQRYESNDVDRPDLRHLGLYRDLIQHRLLFAIPVRCDAMLRDSCETESLTSTRSNSHESLFELDDLFRLGLLIFSIGVTFPIADKRLHRDLAHRLRAQLLFNLHPGTDRKLRCMWIWFLVLGCIASSQASDSELRLWYIQSLVEIMRESPPHGPGIWDSMGSPSEFHYQSWYIIKQKYLQPLLWHSGACDAALKNIWEEVVQYAKLNMELGFDNIVS